MLINVDTFDTRNLDKAGYAANPLEDGSLDRAAVPSGASTGSREANELRDGDSSRRFGGTASASITDANIVFVNGLGFEGWMTRLVKASGTKAPSVVTSKGVKSRKMEEEGHQVTDPHAWQSIANAKVPNGLAPDVAANIAQVRVLENYARGAVVRITAILDGGAEVALDELAHLATALADQGDHRNVLINNFGRRGHRFQFQCMSSRTRIRDLHSLSYE